jgi:hypothetical protein
MQLNFVESQLAGGLSGIRSKGSLLPPGCIGRIEARFNGILTTAGAGSRWHLAR